MEWVLLLLAIGIIFILAISIFTQSPNVEKLIVENNTDGLIRVLQSKCSDQEKMGAISALSQIGDGLQIILPLAAVLKDTRNNSPVVRMAAIKALGGMNQKQAYTAISKALYDSNVKIRRAVVRALSQQSELNAKKLCLALKDPDKVVRKIAADGLVETGDKAIPLFRALLNQPDCDAHLLIFKSLGKIGSEESIDLFQAGLDDSKTEVRISAAKALGNIKDTRGISMLSPLLYDEVKEIRKVSAFSLGEIGMEEAIDPLSQALEKEEDYEVAITFIKALAKLGPASIEGISKALYDRPKDIMFAAVESLGNFNDERAVEALAPMLEEEHLELKKAVINSLAKIGDENVVRHFRNALFRRDMDIRVDIFRALENMRGQSVIELAISGLTDSEDEVRQAAAQVLDILEWQPATTELGCVYWIARKRWDKCLKIGKPAIVPLTETLSNKDEQMWKQAGETIVEIGTPAVEALIQTLQTDDLQMKEKSAELLGRIGDGRAVDPLIENLNYYDAGVRQAVLIALGRIGKLKTLENIRSAMSDSDIEVRQAAGSAMVLFGSSAVKTLIDIIRQEPRYVRQVAASSLVKIGQSSIPYLIESLQEWDRDVRLIVAETLEKLNWIPELNEIGIHYHIVLDHWDECIQAGSIAVNPLIETLLDKANPFEVRKSAAEALGNIGDKQAVDALCKALRDRKREVRRAVADALDQIGWSGKDVEKNLYLYWIAKEQWKSIIDAGTKTVNTLVDFLKDPAIGENVLDTLEQIGSKAVNGLIEALRDEDWEKRKSVAVALGRIGDVHALNALITALEDGDEIVCLAAPKAFAKTKNARPVAALLPFLNHNSYAVRLAAAEALVNFHQQGNIDAQSKSLILSRWRVITQKHTDVHHAESNTHEDEGIGIDI